MPPNRLCPRGRLVGDQPVGNVDRAIGVGGHFGVVRYDDDRDALGVQPLEHPQDLVARLRIEVAGRLVGQQERGTIDEGPCNRHPLLLAAGHLRRLVVQPGGQPHLLEQRLGQPPGLATRVGARRPPLGVVQRHQDIVQGRRSPQEVETLEDKTQFVRPYQGPFVRRKAAHLPAVEPELAGSRAVEAAQDVHQRGLAGTGSPHEGHHFAAGNAQRNSFQHRHINLAETVGLGNALQADEFARPDFALLRRAGMAQVSARSGEQSRAHSSGLEVGGVKTRWRDGLY